MRNNAAAILLPAEWAERTHWAYRAEASCASRLTFPSGPERKHGAHFRKLFPAVAVSFTAACPLLCRFPFPANMSYAVSIKMVGDVQSYWKTENADSLSGCPDRSGTALQSLSVRCIRSHRTFSHRHPAAEQPRQETIYFFPSFAAVPLFLMWRMKKIQPFDMYVRPARKGRDGASAALSYSHGIPQGA